MKKLLYFAITPNQITEEFRDFLKLNGYKIVCTYYSFCPHFFIRGNEDVTYYSKEL